MKYLAMIILLGLGCASVEAAQTPAGGARDDRVRSVVYDALNVVRIVGVMRLSTQVLFSEDEEIVHVAIGDAISWDVAPAGNILFLKPRERHPPTNLQVVTTRRDGRKRSYQFELSSRDGAIAQASDAYFLVRFSYPEDDAERARVEADARRTEAAARQTDNILEYHQNNGPRNWAYAAQGSGAIEPAAVFDDGKTTTFRFVGNTEIPAIFMVNSDDSESLVPKDIRGELVVAHALASKWILRRGSEVICVYNEAYVPAGINPRTGTTSPSVTRVVKSKPAGQK
jgi:type IV secretion system protein VirB9